MTPADARYYDRMLTLVREARISSDEQERIFLLTHNAIDSDGNILCEYPKLFFMSGGETKSHDEGGHLSGIRIKMEQMNKEGINAWIGYVPRFYSFYLMAKKELFGGYNPQNNHVN